MALQTKTYDQTSNTYTLRLTVTETSTSVASNSSLVSYSLTLISTTKDFYQYGVGASVSLDGKVVAVRNRDTAPQVSLGVRSSVTLLSGSATISHNTDGNKTMSVAYSLDMASVSYTPGPMNGSGSMPLTFIPRGASITGAPNFTDEDNPTISLSNPAGVSMQVAIYKDSTHAIAEYRSTNKTSYTFSLTTAERNALRQVNINSNTATVRFYVKSVVASQTFIKYVERTLTIKNPNPTLNPQVEDINPATVALTGGGSIVRYASKAQVTFNAAGVKYATIKSRKVTNGTQSLTNDGTMSGVSSGVFTFSATDSRNNTTVKSVTLPVVEYSVPTCYIESGTPNAEGEFSLSVRGAVFGQSFGDVDNSVDVYYRFRVRGLQDWDDWIPMIVVSTETTYTASADITGLNYQATYEFQAKVVDKLSSVESTVKVVVCRPMFDYGPDSFNFNVPVCWTEYDDEKGTSKVHWFGEYGMTARVSSVPGTITGQQKIPLGSIIDSCGAIELVSGSIRIKVPGHYLISGSIYFDSGVDNVWAGAAARVGGVNVSYAHLGLPGGGGTVVIPPTLYNLNEGSTVELWAWITGTAHVGNDTRTRLTVIKI